MRYSSRFTIRDLIFAVLVVALLLGYAIERRPSPRLLMENQGLRASAIRERVVLPC